MITSRGLSDSFVCRGMVLCEMAAHPSRAQFEARLHGRSGVGKSPIARHKRFRAPEAEVQRVSEGRAALKESTFFAEKLNALAKHRPISEEGRRHGQGVSDAGAGPGRLPSRPAAQRKEKAWPAGVRLKVGVLVPHIPTMAVVCTTDRRPGLHAQNWQPEALRPALSEQSIHMRKRGAVMNLSSGKIVVGGHDANAE